VTFLFTDLEGSTRLWEEHPEAMKAALARHDEILRGAVVQHGGHVVKTTGDGLHAAFTTGRDGVEAAVSAQRMLGAETGPGPVELRVRMGLHTGTAELRDGDYYGSAVNKAARVSAAGHGGQILISQVTEELVRDGLAGELALADLGEHRLRDLARPDHLHAVRGPGLVAEFPPLRTLDEYPGNLPLQVSSFVGRERDLDHVARALGDARLVTLTGVGGVGKTRLAVQVAAEVLPRFPDGAWLCELAAADDADAMLQVVAATLGVHPRPGLGLDESIVEFLHGKEMLVVLDNCEHLLDAAGRLVEGVLHGSAGVRLLATSREGLAAEGEHVVPLRSLSLPGTPDQALLSSEAVRLFAERARAARSDFELDATNDADVVEICRRLDGMPLAIELAAARVVAMSPRDIAGRLDERFRLLTGGRRTAVERHQTLRATVEWSYSLLEPRERGVFDRLGVFAGGFGPEAAEAVVTGEGIEGWDAIDALTSLVSKSMVVTEASEDGQTRYQLLETLRHYAREQLDDHGGADAWRRRHANHFVEIAERLGPSLHTEDELATRRELVADLDNLRAAVTWGLNRDDPGDLELALRIVAALALEATNHRAYGIGAWGERAVNDAEDAAPALRTATLGLAAMSHFYRGQVDDAERLASRAIAEGLPVGCAAATLPYIVLGNLQSNRGDLAAAHSVIDAGIAAMQAVGLGDWHVAILQTCAAIWSAQAGMLDDARVRMDAVMPVVRRLRNPTMLAIALYTLGWALWLDAPDDSLAAFRESLAITRDGATEAVYGPALAQAARLHARQGRSRESLASLHEAFQHCDNVADRVEFAGICLNAIETLGWIDGCDEDVARLLGIIQADALMAFAPSIQGPEREARSSSVDGARGHLGNDAFDALVRQGSEMSYDEIAAYAITRTSHLLREHADT